MENKHNCPKKIWDQLTDHEKRIYNSVRDNFPKSGHQYALDKAYEGGIKFQFIPT